MCGREVSTLITTCLLATACAAKLPVSDARLCDRLDEFARTVLSGQSKTIRFIRGGTWMVDHYKLCSGPENDTAGEEFCRWLLENSSTEFMEVNINRALSCLQGQRIIGYIGNTGIESWSGKALFFSPRISADVAVEVEYSVGPEKNDKEDFIQFKVMVN